MERQRREGKKREKKRKGKNEGKGKGQKKRKEAWKKRKDDGRGEEKKEATASVPQHLTLLLYLVIQVMMRPKTVCLKNIGKPIASGN